MTTKQQFMATVDRISGNKTARVVLKESVVHGKYQKRFAKQSHRLVDTGSFSVEIGNSVMIEEIRPISKLKSWKLSSVLSNNLPALPVDKEMI